MTIEKTLFRSKIDWWLWPVIFAPTIWIFALDAFPWWYSLFIGVPMTVIPVVLMLGCWYVIEGRDLVVYQFFRPTRLPIDKIKSVRKTTGFLATAGMSHLRVSIAFSDRSVLKSYAPLEISPRDRDGFIALLAEINPSIEIIK